jgi:uncharacterized protein (DUF433 family)
MGAPLRKPRYPYIVSDTDIAGGSPIIEGTRVTVRSIAGYYQMGLTVDEILTTLSHLSPSQIHSALAYYFDNQEEIDADLATSGDMAYWEKQALSRLQQD